MSWLSIVGEIVGIASSGAKVYGAYQEAEYAKDTQKIQEQEILRQQQLSAAAARRDARVRTAQLYSQQGIVGISTSMGSSGVVGIGSTLASGLEDLSERTSFNIESSEMQRDTAVNSAYTQGVLGLTSFAAGAASFSDSLGTKEQVSKTGPYKEGYKYG